MTATVVDAGDGLPLTLPALLRARAESRGASVLLACDDDVLTYAAAERRSAALARGLVAAGAGPGTHVGILHQNGSASTNNGGGTPKSSSGTASRSAAT